MLWVAEAKGPHPDPAYDEFLSVIVDFQGIYIYLHKIQLNEKLKKKEKECRIFFRKFCEKRLIISVGRDRRLVLQQSLRKCDLRD